MLPGYDRDHARRTTAIVLRVAPEVGIGSEWLERLEATALLHDLGRVGMDPALFGRIFTLAHEAGLPVRLPEFKELYPNAREELGPGLWLDMARTALEKTMSM